jgi:hypothetical protein
MSKLYANATIKRRDSVMKSLWRGQSTDGEWLLVC